MSVMAIFRQFQSLHCAFFVLCTHYALLHGVQSGLSLWFTEKQIVMKRQFFGS